MSDYTTQLRFICESYAGQEYSLPQADIDDIIHAARSKIFSFDYPIFDENYRETLEEKILSHYYTEEIGSETVGLWKHQLKNKMREIMPFYNQLYLSERIKFDPLINQILTDSRNTSGETTSHGTETGGRTSVLSFNEKSDTEKVSDTLGINDVKTDGAVTLDHDINLVDHSKHNDSEDYQDSGSSTKTGGESKTQSGYNKTTNHTHDSKTDETTKEGAELTVDMPAHNLSILRKHSDTPLGGIDGTTGGSQAGDFVPGTGGGAGAVENYSNYLSDVSEEVQNFDRNPATGSDSKRKRNRSWTVYGEYFNPDGDTPSERRVQAPRVDSQSISGDSDSTNEQYIDSSDRTNRNENEAENKTGSRNKSGYEYHDQLSKGSETNTDKSNTHTRDSSVMNANDTTKSTGEKLGNDKTQRDTEGSTKEERDYFGRLYGKSGSASFSQMLMEYRQTFLNIDMQVINELQPLFMGIW